jgi:hypothetical protein
LQAFPLVVRWGAHPDTASLSEPIIATNRWRDTLTAEASPDLPGLRFKA